MSLPPDPCPAGARARRSVADGYDSRPVPLAFLFLASSCGGPIVWAVMVKHSASFLIHLAFSLW